MSLIGYKIQPIDIRNFIPENLENMCDMNYDRHQKNAIHKEWQNMHHWGISIKNLMLIWIISTNVVILSAREPYCTQYTTERERGRETYQEMFKLLPKNSEFGASKIPS